MIVLRRAMERHHLRHPERDAWLTFYPTGRVDPLAESFGNLISLTEVWFPPGAHASREQHPDGELLTYVRDGSLTHEDSSGDSGLIQAGEFHLLSVKGGGSRLELNASRVDSAHVYNLCLRHSAAMRPAQQQRFSTAQRRGLFCLIASSDARRGSLRVDCDASIYSAGVEPGQHVVHEMATGRSTWLHVVHGAVAVGDLMLNAGDGIGISAERGVAVTPHEDSELLLVDLLEPRTDSAN